MPALSSARRRTLEKVDPLSGWNGAFDVRNSRSQTARGRPRSRTEALSRDDLATHRERSLLPIDIVGAKRDNIAGSQAQAR